MDWLDSDWWVRSRCEVGNNVVIGWWVRFDASLHADVIRRSHSGGSAVLPTFLDIAAGLCIIS